MLTASRDKNYAFFYFQHPYFSIGVRPSLPLSSSPANGERPSSHSILNPGKDATNLEVDTSPSYVLYSLYMYKPPESSQHTLLPSV